MAGSVQQFWQMIVRSGLHDEAACRQFADAFFKAKDAGDLAIPSLPEWLVANKALTRYQAKILIAGQPGPFVFDEYVVTDRIESGRLAGQFRALHRATGCAVCLRFLSGPQASDPALFAALGEQAAAANALSRDTTRLAHCYTLVDAGTHKFFVLEGLSGQSLGELLAKKNVIPPAHVARMIAHVAKGLACLHRAGRAHGEIWPESVWIESSGVKLLSFPWSPDPISASAGAAGSAGAQAASDYWPPERSEQSPATRSGDFYAIGCVLYQMLSGKVPFPGPDSAARRAAHASATPALLEKIAAGVSPDLSALVARLLAKKPAERISDFAELLKALASFEGGVDKASEAPAPLRIALDDAVAMRRAQTTVSAAQTISFAQPQASPAPTPITPTKGAKLEPRGAASASAAPQQAGVSSLAGLIDPDEPTIVAKPRIAAAAPEDGKKKRLPLIVAAASTVVVLIIAAILVISRGFGDGSPPQQSPVVAQIPNPAPSPVVPDELPIDTSPDEGGPVSPGEGEANASGAPTAKNPPGEPNAPATPPSGEPTAGSRGAEQLVGVGGTMWASPTDGKPLDLAYLPPGAEVIFVIRPADLSRHPEAQRLLDPRTTGALGAWINERLPALAGAPLANIEQAIIALMPAGDGPPRLALVAQLKAAPAESDLLKSWGNPQPKEADGEKYYQKEDTAYYIPSGGAGRTIVVAPAALLVEDILPNGANPPALRREMETLLRSSDADRLVTLLAAPNILLTGGDEWFPGSAGRVRSPLDWFLAGEPEDRAAPLTPSGKEARRGPMTDLSSKGLPKALLASAHLTDTDLFVEVRLLADPNQPAAKLAEAYRQRVARLPRRASDYLRTLALGEYSRDVLIEFPLMVEQLSHFTVAGTEGRQVVLRTYLPVLAAHNLALGGHLAMLESPRAGGAPAPPQTALGPAKPTPTETTSNQPMPEETVAERLGRKMSLNFERNTLEPTLKQIGQEIGVEVVILGADLQSDGITRNKAIDKFSERDVSAREILLKIMSKANPDGKLIYVIKPAESGTGEALYFTTRTAAGARGDKLPAEFEK
ncbi:MAG TPA: protein kinase [Pirellulales bacterium]|jgi:serine/threonine-protein kinase